MPAVVALLSALLAAPDTAPLVLVNGTPIALDGRIADAEWSDAFSAEAPHPFGGTVRVRLKRNGPWLALAAEGTREYGGELLWIYVRDDTRAWATHLLFGIGQPAYPPLLWRRAPPEALLNPEFGPGESPRAARARLDVGGSDGWRAEYLVRLSALGIGRGDLREFAAMVRMVVPDTEQIRPLLIVPEGATNPTDLESYAPLQSPEGWGADEQWEPVAPEASAEFNDHELLYRLFVEHEAFSLRGAPDQLVIANAVRPRSATRIALLRSELEAGRRRNPSLPQWQYFLGRLFHEGNLFEEAAALVETIPHPLTHLDPFVNLRAEHYMDTEQWQKCLDVCASYPEARGMRETVGFATAGQRAWARELVHLARDKRKETINPVIRIVTEKGEIDCELFEDDAPYAVRNFIDLIWKRRFYDGQRFVEVAGGSVVTLGDPATRPGAAGEEGPAWRLRADDSPRSLLRGYLGTVPAQAGVFHGSKFFIAVVPLMKESAQVTTFGRVIRGLDVLESIDQDDAIERVEILKKRNHAYATLA